MSTEPVKRPESYCSTCKRVVLGARCRSCRRQLAPIAEGWDLRSKQVKAELEARESESEQAPETAAAAKV